MKKKYAVLLFDRSKATYQETKSVCTNTNLILLVLVVLQLLIENAQTHRIVAGVRQISYGNLISYASETSPGEWPWHAAVYHRTAHNKSYVCGGTLISERFILTAAHCAIAENGQQLPNESIFVCLSVHNLHEPNNNTMQNHSVRKIHIYPNYAKNGLQNDIAIIELDTKPDFNEYVQPIGLCNMGDLTGLFGTAIGWGMTENDEESPVLKSKQMPVVDVYTCLKSNRQDHGATLSEGIFCAGYTNGTAVCNDDSGGGFFFHQNRSRCLGGITAFMPPRGLGDQRCSIADYACFTNVTKFSPWILSKTGLQVEPHNDTVLSKCTTLETCTQCVSQFLCGWCLGEHRCTYDPATNCSFNDTVVASKSRNVLSSRSGPKFCPMINVTDEGQEIMVVSGTKKQIEVKVHVFDQFRLETNFMCQFNIEGRTTTVNAQLRDDMIYCDEMEFAYRTKRPNLTATFAVIWNGSKLLDNPNNIRVVIYRCAELADSCGICLTLNEKYQCGWCSSSNTCEVEHHCDISGKIKDQQKKNWMNNQQTCPNPEIHSFEPKSGPLEGGTNVMIQGINLGKKFEDVYGGVKVAGVHCMPIRELYIKSQMIVCKLKGPGVKNHLPGPVVVQISDFRVESTYDFMFVDPEITDFTPKIGPIAGGTILKIVGKYLNTGSRVKVYLDRYPCEILRMDNHEVTCRTASVRRTMVGKLYMKFDNGVREFNGDMFEYISNPWISYVSSGYSEQTRIARGILAGDIEINVFGDDFSSIEKPKIYVYYRDQIFQKDCKSISNKKMQCYSPEINLQKADIFQSDEPLQLEYGFIMDDVESVKNMSSKLGHSFELYPNPEYQPFDENLKYINSEYLTINGSNLDWVFQESDVTVTIGDNMICNITSLSRNQLTCLLPKGQEIKKAYVKVIVGNKLTYNIGQMTNSPESLTNQYTVGALVSVAIVIFIAVKWVACGKYTKCHHRLIEERTADKRPDKHIIEEYPLKFVVDSGVITNTVTKIANEETVTAITKELVRELSVDSGVVANTIADAANEKTITGIFDGHEVKFFIDPEAKVNTVTEAVWRKLEREETRFIKKVNLCSQHAELPGHHRALVAFDALVSVKETMFTNFAQFFVLKEAQRCLLSERMAKYFTAPEIQNKLPFPKFSNTPIKLSIDHTVTLKIMPYCKIMSGLKEKLNQKLQQMLDSDIIEPVYEPSKWISPIVVVPNGINDIRLYIDMRNSNKAIKQDDYPIPPIGTLLDTLKNAVVLSKIVIKSAYYHVELDPASRDITTFITNKGLMRFKRLMSDISCAPQIFQRVMCKMLAGIKGVVVYNDNIIVWGSTPNEHNERLKQVLYVLKENHAILDNEKCLFEVQEVDILDFKVSVQGINPSDDKVAAIRNLRFPDTKGEVSSFLKLLEIFECLKLHLSTSTEALFRFTEEATDSVDAEQLQAFDDLRNELSNNVHSLRFFDPRDQTELFVHASTVGFGTVLVQKDNQNKSRIVSFASKGLTKTEKLYPQTQREALAVVWAVEKFSSYLLRVKFVVHTDHESLKNMSFGKHPKENRKRSRIEAWALRLQLYDFVVVNKPSYQNISIIYAKSCPPSDVSFDEASEHFVRGIGEGSSAITLDEIREATAQDDILKIVAKSIETQAWPSNMYAYKEVSKELGVINGVVVRNDLIVLPSRLRQRAFNIADRSNVGVALIKRNLMEKLWWPSMNNEIEEHYNRLCRIK